MSGDGMENCPTCGSLVCVVGDDEEGTSHYEPVGSQRVEHLRQQLAGAVEALGQIAAHRRGGMQRNIARAALYRLGVVNAAPARNPETT